MNIKRLGIFFLFATALVKPYNAVAQQKAYFVDGFHGGIWGHYPEGYTKYIIGQINEHPGWRVNLEIEPQTWEREKKLDPAAYAELQRLLAVKGSSAKVEYVNPAFGQSYFFNTSGESIIRQFYYGIKMLRQHFPEAEYKSYSSEEPCYTSALPQILNSFGFKYASLKNPNTCWGGYTRAHGGELVYWTGPDGSRILTVPRYEIESLKPGSTWETIASGNSPEYINNAFDYGIKQPVGMCLQDAGWEWGPWLKGKQYKPSIYTTWRNYFENITDTSGNVPEWKFTQEDVQVSLVWGSQVLQQLAQNVRVAENNIVQAEKTAVIDFIAGGKTYPNDKIDNAWEQLLLAQHHDCWIVPYNGKPGNTWADMVKDWTGVTNKVSDEIITGEATADSKYIVVYNTSGYSRADYVTLEVPEAFNSTGISLLDNKKSLVADVVSDNDKTYLKFKADVPAFGYKVLKIDNKASAKKTAITFKQKNDITEVESKRYKITFDAKKGGAITSLIAKDLDKKEFVDETAAGQFSGLQGNFYNNGGSKNTYTAPAQIRVKAQGENFIAVEVITEILSTKVTKTITLTNDNPRIDFNLKIDWKDNVGIGAFDQYKTKAEPATKAFYNDKEKLVTLFPLNLKGQRIFKNAPFDVLESQLDDTFFESWDSIKNNIIVNWVDVTDNDGKYGCALFTDHTTTYTHGKDFPLGLNVQFSGAGLWGRNYTIDGPTEINYVLVPHKGNWKDAGIWTQNRNAEEPLRARLVTEKPAVSEKSLLQLSKKGWELVSAEKKEDGLYIRIFNAEGDATPGKVSFGFNPGNAGLVKLNGETEGSLTVKKSGTVYETELAIPQFGFRTIKVLQQ
ncbi:glycoside hydrolase family 38 C-terminal domain-containing protein [Flavobacterium psychrotrophum]|uniref:glycoside hydrolase family 38 C-terminal domain-containing protein n=1 Tax=Flavobacterium psychrotrophum TaxID=2294119 RepID=UPI000E31F098|nr:glycoside hydrolase family 38 C-terminal domain-containing protein [Flavobacterium psychrotrophum]